MNHPTLKESMDVLLKELENTRLEVKMTENRMSVDEAVALLKRYIDRNRDNSGSAFIYDEAIRTVLHELRALQECSSCTCDKIGDWASK